MLAVNREQCGLDRPSPSLRKALVTTDGEGDAQIEDPPCDGSLPPTSLSLALSSLGSLE
jgi:hypothetical protein